MTPVGQHKAGVVAVALMGASHLLWFLLVALGLARPLIDFVFWMHFKPVFAIAPFSVGRGDILVVVTIIVVGALSVPLSFDPQGSRIDVDCILQGSCKTN